MNKLVELIKLLEEIFGKGAVSRTIGTRTNVVRFPKGKQPIDPTRGELDVEGTAAKNPDLVQVIENSIEDRMGDITKMNDQELLTYTANVRRLRNFKKPPVLPEADVVKFGSGEEIKGKGLEELIEKQGTRFSPTTDIGQLEATGKKLEKLSEDFAREFDPENIAKQEAERRAMIARQYESKGFAGDVISGPSGIFRAVSREFLLDQNAKGKIKLTPETVKNLENRDYISGGQPLMYPDPIRIMRHHYGDDVFDKIPLDKLYRSSGARSDILEVMSKVEAPPLKTEPPKTPGGYLTPGEYRANIEEMQKIEDAIKRRESRFADMTEEEIQNELSQYGGKRSSFEMGLEQDYPEEFAKYKKPKDPFEPEEKADGGRIGFSKGKKVMSQIDKLIEQLNKKTKGKKSMESVDPKTGEVTVPKKPIRRAEEPTGMTTMDPEPDIIDEKAITKSKSRQLTKEEIEDYEEAIGKNSEEWMSEGTVEEAEKALKRSKAEEAYYRTQYKLGKLDPEPGEQTEARMKFLQKKMEEAADVKDRRLITPKEIEELMELESRFIYKKGDDITEENFGNSPFAPSQETLDNLKKAREMTKGMSLHDEMNMVLNQYDKSMFIKNEQGMVDVTNPENVQKMALLLKRDFPDLYKRLEGETQTNVLEDFDITGREPNANGGIAGLL